MCGGIGYKISKFTKKQLKEYFSEEQITKAESSGNIQVHFWSPKAIIPVIISDKHALVEWGNKDKNLHLPKTGWAREKSIDQGN